MLDDASMSGAPSEAGEALLQSEGGDGASDSCSAVPSTRNLRRKKEAKKETKKTAAVKKGTVKEVRGRNGGGGKMTRSARGKGRRSLAKKKPVKAADTAPTVVTSDKVYFEGQYLQVGDIVSVTDMDDDDVYYAQLRGFLTDEFAEKSAVISWLLPTTDSPPPGEGFHPATYIIGPEEDTPRKLEVFTFVMHAPDDYFYNRKAPYRYMWLSK